MGWLRALWRRLTWMHIISIKPGNNCPLKEGEWYTCCYHIKLEGKDIAINDVQVKTMDKVKGET